MEDETNQPTGSPPDGISCVGVLLLAFMVLTALGVGVAQPSGENLTVSTSLDGSLTPNQLFQDKPLAEVTRTIPSPTSLPPTYTPLPTASPTIPPTASPTPEPTFSPTPTPMATLEDQIFPPTATPTASPSPFIEPTPSGVYSWTLEVPILMYHYISTAPDDADKYRLDLSVSPEAFRSQMRYLAERGYSTIDLYDLSLAITNKRELPPKPIVITLDDGYRDNYENAYPILKELGMTATFFLATEFIDQGNPNYMNWAMIEEMAAAGMRFEPHSKTHPDLSGKDRAYIVYEVLGSRETIEAHIGYTPRYFAYPSGRYDDQVLAILQELDFWGAVTTAGGVWHGYNDRFEWTRVRIRNETTLTDLASFLD